VEVLAHGPRRSRERFVSADDRGFRLFRVLALAVLLKALSFPPFLAEGLRCVPIFLQRELGSTGWRRFQPVGSSSRTRSYPDRCRNGTDQGVLLV
jgi:hypothetical protein